MLFKIKSYFRRAALFLVKGDFVMSTVVKRKKTTMAAVVRAADPTYKTFRPTVYYFKGREFKDPRIQPYAD